MSVIILNYNGRSLSEPCLASVLNTEYSNFEVIFVDNGSTDGSVEFIKKRFSDYLNNKLKLIINPKNLGFAEGNNIGAKHAAGKYLAFLNNDVEVEPSWLKELVSAEEADQEVAVTQSKLLMADRKHFDSAGDILSSNGSLYQRGRLEEDLGQYDTPEEIFSARGAAMLIRRKTFDEVEGFDAKFFIIYEDVDLSWRIRLRGYKIVFIPTSVVYHMGSATSSRKTLRSFLTFHRQKNRLILVLKNYESKNAMRFLIRNLILLSSGWLIYRDPMPRLKALMWAISNFKLIWNDRLKVQCTRLVDDKRALAYTKKNLNAYTHMPQ